MQAIIVSKAKEYNPFSTWSRQQETDPVKIYLDVDGVLNAVNRALPAWGWSPGSLKRQEINGYVITWSTELVDAFNQVTALPGVEVVWLTTWEERAATMIAPALGLTGGETWPVLLEADHPAGDGFDWWKTRAMAAQLAADEVAIWLDDDLPTYPLTRDWVDQHAHLHTLAPRIETGMTWRQAQLLRSWVESG